MLTTLAETYMTATRVDAMFGYRMGETERLHRLSMRREEERRWVAEQERAVAKARRRARARRMRTLAAVVLVRLGEGIARAGRSLAPHPAAAPC